MKYYKKIAFRIGNISIILQYICITDGEKYVFAHDFCSNLVMV